MLSALGPQGAEAAREAVRHLASDPDQGDPLPGRVDEDPWHEMTDLPFDGRGVLVRLGDRFPIGACFVGSWLSFDSRIPLSTRNAPDILNGRGWRWAYVPGDPAIRLHKRSG